MNKNIAVFALVMLVIGSLATYSAPQAFADWLIDRSGTLVKIDPSILGDDADNSLTTSSRSQETTTELQKQQLEKQTEQAKNNLEATKKTQENTKEALKKQIEQRKKTKEKSGQTSEFEVNSEGGKLKIKQELRDATGALIKKSETEIGDESLHIEQANGETVEINSIGEDRLEMVKNKIKTESDLDLKLDAKNAISVTLPNGKTKEISLPDQALERLVANGVIARTIGVDGSYLLVAGKNGDPVYSGIEGEIEKSILGFKIKFKQKIDIAAGDSEDGTVLAGDIVSKTSQETSPWRLFLERLAR